jgi:hypothetical protein
MDAPLPDLDEALKRPQRYWNVDGLAELVMGCVWLVWGVCLLIQDILPPGRWTSVYAAVVPLLLVISSLSANWVVKKLKAKLTYPRTGYVKLNRPGAASRIASGLVAAGVAAAIVALVIKGQARTTQELVAPVFALVIAVACLVAASFQRAPRYIWISAGSLAMGVMLLQQRPTLNTGMVELLLGLGVSSMLVGGIRLRRFLKDNPVPAGDGL